MDYAELTKLIKEYCENAEDTFVANIPSFVQLAERRTYQTVPVLAMWKNKTGAVTKDNRYLTLPVDWLSTDSIAVIMPTTGEYRYMLPKEVEYVREAYPFPLAAGVPGYYAQFDENTFILGPTPDEDYAVELHYLAYPESIVTANRTWLGDNFEFVLLYGALREAYIYMKGESDVIEAYEKKYGEAMSLLMNHLNVRVRTDNYRHAKPPEAGVPQ